MSNSASFFLIYMVKGFNRKKVLKQCIRTGKSYMHISIQIILDGKMPVLIDLWGSGTGWGFLCMQYGVY